MKTHTCAACSNQFQSARSDTKYCSHACYATSLKNRTPHNAMKPESRNCARCGQSFDVRPTSTKKYCSLKCSNSKEAKPVVWNTLPRVEVVCAHCGTAFNATEPEIARGRKYCSKACVDDVKRGIVGSEHPLFKPKVPMACEMCGRVVDVKPSLVSRFRFCSRRCTGAWVATNWPRTSSIEYALRDELDRRGVKFVPDFALGPYSIDVAFPESRLAVEVDGSYWHGLNKQGPKDRAKDEHIRASNWRIVRLTEPEIRSDVAACVDRIMALLVPVNI